MNVYKAMLNMIVKPLCGQDRFFLERRITELKQSGDVFREDKAIAEVLEGVIRYIDLAEEIGSAATPVEHGD